MASPEFDMLVAFIQWLRDEGCYICRRDLESSCESCGGTEYEDTYETDEQFAEKFLARRK